MRQSGGRVPRHALVLTSGFRIAEFFKKTMKYAILVKLGGEIILADEADYQERQRAGVRRQKGILVPVLCP